MSQPVVNVLSISPEEAIWQEWHGPLECSITAIVATIRDDDKRLHQLYCAMCNIIWIRPELEIQASISWRQAGGVVADARGKGEDYLDYYCSGIGGYEDLGCTEGVVLPWVHDAFAKLGWEPRLWPEDDSDADAVLTNYWPRDCIVEGGTFFMKTDRGEIIVVTLEGQEKPVRFQIKRFIAESRWADDKCTDVETRCCAIMETTKGGFVLRRDSYAERKHVETWNAFKSLKDIASALDLAKPEEKTCSEKITHFRETMDLAEI